MEHCIPIYTLSLWMKFVDYLSLQVFPMMLSKGRSSLYLWREMHWHGIGYVMIWDHGTTNDWNWNFIRSFILCILFIVIVIIYIIFGLAKEKASLKLGGGLSQCYIHAPIMSSQEKWLFKKFMLGFLSMIAPCSILLVLALLWWRLLNSNGIYWKELNATLKIGISTKVRSQVWHLSLIVLNLLWIPMFSVNLALNMDLTLR